MSDTETKGMSGWVGWVGFAAVVILLNGLFSIIQGSVAVIGSNYYYVVGEGGLVVFDLTGWGWWNIIIGVVLALTGFALFSGATWARVLAVIIASLSALGQLFLIPAQPWWSLIVIAIDVLVIYAITVHGRDLKH
ncbi:DUF7144 family membrane protein [Agromyces aureus]|uniref:DUF7144 domain-containing protein n=1 Tax=Agromyces aureus TaxID=453304 RepID=A0A191WEF0_9MICO|nr:hypothetical protein [Agromyces aureus]ANJ26655.1 hypothetical protein ATC03_07965 [Agromyces aureus]